MKIKVSQLRKLIKEELSSQYLKIDRNNLIEKILDIQLAIEGIEKNSPEWYERWGDIRDKINSALNIEWHDDLDEGFLDKAKNLGKAGMLALGLSGNAYAQPNTYSDMHTLSSDEVEPEDDVVYLQDEEGNSHKFYWLIEVELNGKTYAALRLEEQGEDNDKIFLFHYKLTKYGEDFREIKDESEWEAVRQKVEEELGDDS